MKRILLVLTAATLTIGIVTTTGCKKPNSNDITNRFIGSWERRLNIKTITFLDVTPPTVYKDTTTYATGKDICVDILNNYTYVERDYAFGPIIDSGSYIITSNKVIVKSAYYLFTDTLDGSSNENELSLSSSYTTGSVRTDRISFLYRR